MSCQLRPRAYIYVYFTVPCFSESKATKILIFSHSLGTDNATYTEKATTTFNNAITNVSGCLVLFLSTTGLFSARRKSLEHEMQSSALTIF